MKDNSFPNTATPLGSSNYYISRFSPAPLRDDVATLFLWKKQLLDLQQLSDPGVARLKLQWWKQQLTDPQTAHPLAQQLHNMTRQHALDIDCFHYMADEMDNRLRQLPTRDLEHYFSRCQQFGGQFALLLHRLTPANHPDEALKAGTWIEVIDNIRNLGAALRHEQCFLPADHISQLDAIRHSQPDAQTVKYLTGLIEQAQPFRPEKPTEDSLGRPLCNAVKLGNALLKQIKHAGFDILSQRISLTPVRKLWHCWW